MATEYSESKFIGIDKSDFEPRYPSQTKPHNVEFFQADVLRLPYEDNTFDYVFCRSMMFVFKMTEWEIAIKEICRVCKVGGYVEFMETDISIENEKEFTKKTRERGKHI